MNKCNVTGTAFLVVLNIFLTILTASAADVASNQKKESFIWLEKPFKGNFPVTVNWDNLAGGSATALSPERPVPEKPFVEYSFVVGGENPSVFSIWGHAYDLNWSSPARWRVDEQEWRKWTPQDAVDRAVANGTFVMEWRKWGTIELAPGKHTLRLETLGKRAHGDYAYFVLDALLLVEGGYVPTGTGTPAETFNERFSVLNKLTESLPDAESTKFSSKADKLRAKLSDGDISSLRNLDLLTEEARLAVEKKRMISSSLQSPLLHGSVESLEIRDGHVELKTSWDHPFTGDIWVGFLQQGVFYSSCIVPSDGRGRSLSHTLPVPSNLPSGNLTVICVPTAQPLAGLPCGELQLPDSLADKNPQPAAHGIYRDALNRVHPWNITPGNALCWDGAPYIPMGGMMNSSLTWQSHAGGALGENMVQREMKILRTRLELLKSNGIRDVYFNGFFVRSNPRLMQGIISLCEELGMCYGLHVSSVPSRTSLGFHRKKACVISIPEKSESAEIEFCMPTGKAPEQDVRCLWYLVDREKVTAAGITLLSRGEELAEGLPTMSASKKAQKVVPFRAKLALKRSKHEQKLFYLPELPMGSSDMAGYGEYLDSYLARLKGLYGSLSLGPGFRMWIDPFQNEAHASADTLCTARLYRDGFAAWLQQRYSTIEELNEAWAIKKSSLKDFTTASRLVPLHENDKDAIWFDAEQDKLYTMNMAISAALQDLKLFRGFMGADALKKASDTLKSIADVPVVLKHNCWISDWFYNRELRGGLDGHGMEAYCYGDSLVYHNAAVVYAEALASPRNEWVLTTESSAAAFEGQKKYVGYLDRLQMLHDIDLLTMQGSRGFYHFGFDFTGNPIFNTTELMRDPRQLEWLGRHGRLYAAAAERLVRARPEYHGWYPAHLRHKNVLGVSARKYEMDGHYMGTATQIRQAPDGRWILPALRPDSDWYSLLVADDLLPAWELKNLDAGLISAPIRHLGKGSDLPLNGFTSNGIGVIPAKQRADTLDDFRNKVLGYRVFQTEDFNGQTLPEGGLLVWTCRERSTGTLNLPAGAKAVSLAGNEIAMKSIDGRKQLTLKRPEYVQLTENRPDYIRQGYYCPNGQPEVAVISGAGVDEILSLNVPVWYRWLPNGLDVSKVIHWHEAESFSATSFTQPLIEGYSRYSSGSAIGINTHFSPPAGHDFRTSYEIDTPAVGSAVFALRRMVKPAMTIVVEVDGKRRGVISADGKGSDIFHLSPWDAGLGVDNLTVAWFHCDIGGLSEGHHKIDLIAVEEGSLTGELDTKLMGADAEKNVGAPTDVSELKGLQIDAWALFRN